MDVKANQIYEKFHEAGIGHESMDLMELVEWTMDVDATFQDEEDYVRHSLITIADSHYSKKLKIQNPDLFKKFLPATVSWLELPEWYTKLIALGYNPLDKKITIGIHFDKKNEIRARKRIRTEQVLKFLDVGGTSHGLSEDDLYKMFKKKLNQTCVEINDTDKMQNLSKEIIELYQKRYQEEMKN